MGLTVGYLDNLGKKLFPKHFLGCFPSDIHPKISKRKKHSIIYNLAPHNNKGTHFVTIFADESKVFYFDSFGNDCTNKNILKFLKKLKEKRKYIYNKMQIQDFSSVFCGYFCISFILALELNTPFNKFINIFEKNDLEKNDEKLIDFIVAHIKKLY